MRAVTTVLLVEMIMCARGVGEWVNMAAPWRMCACVRVRGIAGTENRCVHMWRMLGSASKYTVEDLMSKGGVQTGSRTSRKMEMQEFTMDVTTPEDKKRPGGEQTHTSSSCMTKQH